MAKKQSYKIKYGQRGEQIAGHFLQGKGLKIITRNFRTRWGEIDLIAKDKNQTVFVEVKMRSGQKSGYPEEAIRKRKIASIKRTASIFKDENPNNADSLRIDAIAIIADKEKQTYQIRWFKNISEDF